MAQESRDGSGRKSASDDASAGLPAPQTRSRPASDLPRSLGQGTNSPGAASPLLATQSDHHSPSQPGLTPFRPPPCERALTSPRCPCPAPEYPAGGRARRLLSRRESSPGPRAPGVAGPPLPIIPQAMKCRGTASLVLCSLTKWKSSFFTNPNPERNQGHVSLAGRTQDIGLSKGMCIAVAKEKKIKNQ